ncbi:hypothetical protein OSB04_014526 [Centaurea solstitialis]|uniref:Uncharacterized protein n=1 Tax=Centaurea solstitialis TaxID=347529 RepID=A0AA38T8G9_9ASTR|nr:hypothetical protein OSB04_014526 [Centaurea solstitialis]
MASISKPSLALALMIIIVLSSSSHTITTADARSPYNHVRILATNCDPIRQVETPGCGGGGGSGNGGSSRPSGPAPGASRCRKGCCGKNKLGDCICCK